MIKNLCSGLLFLFYIRCALLRAWYNGSTSASQAEDEGSIPFARTKNTADPCGRIYFWRCGVGREPDRVANGNERVRDEAQRSERGPWSENEHGNIHSLRPHQELNRPKGRFFYMRLTLFLIFLCVFAMLMVGVSFLFVCLCTFFRDCNAYVINGFFEV